MIEDSEGNIYTDYDFLKKIINDVNINVMKTEALMKKMNSLVSEINNTIEYKYYSQQLKGFYNLVKQQKLGNYHKIEDYLDKMLAIYKEFFFIQGFKEGKKSCLNKDRVR